MKLDMSDLNHVYEIASLMRDRWITGLVELLESVVLFVYAKMAQGEIVEIGSYKGMSTIFLAKGSKAGGKHKVTAIDPWLLSEVAGRGGGSTYSKYETTSWPTWRSFLGERYPRVIEPTEIILEDKWFAPLILALDHFHSPKPASRPPPEPSDVYQCFMNNVTNAGVDDIINPMRMTSEKANLDWDKEIGLLFIDGDHRYEFVEKDYRLWAPFLMPGGLLIMHDRLAPGIIKVIEELKSDGEFCDYQIVQGCFLARKKGRPKI